MEIEKRRKRIVELVGSSGFMSIEDLSALLDVSAQTIRRDIVFLDSTGQVARHHGGAALASHSVQSGAPVGKETGAGAKFELANLVAQSLAEVKSVFIAGGSTMEAVAWALLDNVELKVITCSLPVASILMGSSDIHVVMTAGTVRKSNGVTYGPDTINSVDRFRCDVALFGCGGITEDGDFLDFTSSEIATIRAMMANARSNYVAADNSKFTSSANVLIADATEIDVLFTDMLPADPLREVLVDKGVEIRTPE